MAALWESMIEHPLMNGPLNLAQITLACGLALEARNLDMQWRTGQPQLSAWFDRISKHPSLAATAPPGASFTNSA
jgi:glutathione S-transferase